MKCSIRACKLLTKKQAGRKLIISSPIWEVGDINKSFRQGQKLETAHERETIESALWPNQPLLQVRILTHLRASPNRTGVQQSAF